MKVRLGMHVDDMAWFGVEVKSPRYRTKIKHASSWTVDDWLDAMYLYDVHICARRGYTWEVVLYDRQGEREYWIRSLPTGPLYKYENILGVMNELDIEMEKNFTQPCFNFFLFFSFFLTIVDAQVEHDILCTCTCTIQRGITQHKPCKHPACHPRKIVRKFLRRQRKQNLPWDLRSCHCTSSFQIPS